MVRKPRLVIIDGAFEARITIRGSISKCESVCDVSVRTSIVPLSRSAIVFTFKHDFHKAQSFPEAYQMAS